jgi:pyruvate/2-oxoacid:ferredoxin oxidoreductase beta subunit
MMSDQGFKYGKMAVACPGCGRMFYVPTVTNTSKPDTDKIQCRRCVQTALSVEVDE